VTFKILQEMFFLFPEENEDINLTPKIFDVKISIKSETKMILRFLISERLAQVMAENFLGETISSEAEIKEVLKEFVNMVGGNFISLIDPNSKGSLGLPQVFKIEAKKINEISSLKKFNIEGEIFGFAIEGE